MLVSLLSNDWIDTKRIIVNSFAKFFTLICTLYICPFFPPFIFVGFLSPFFLFTSSFSLSTQAIDLIDTAIVPNIMLHVFVGDFTMQINDSILEDSLVLQMVVDVVTERGYVLFSRSFRSSLSSLSSLSPLLSLFSHSLYLPRYHVAVQKLDIQTPESIDPTTHKINLKSTPSWEFRVNFPSTILRKFVT